MLSHEKNISRISQGPVQEKFSGVELLTRGRGCHSKSGDGAGVQREREGIVLA